MNKTCCCQDRRMPPITVDTGFTGWAYSHCLFYVSERSLCASPVVGFKSVKSALLEGTCLLVGALGKFYGFV